MEKRKFLATADGSPTVLDPRSGATYHSLDGALEESRHVYLSASGLLQRLESRPNVCVLEIGFGTGLNFTLAAEAALEYPASRLEYVSLEPYPLTVSEYQAYHQAIGSRLELSEIVCRFPDEGEWRNISYQLLEQPFTPETRLPLVADVIFYDAFGPQAAPEMWTDALLENAFRHLAPDGTLTTFSVTGQFKRFLRSRNIPFHTPKGFGRKREMMVAGTNQKN